MTPAFTSSRSLRRLQLRQTAEISDSGQFGPRHFKPMSNTCIFNFRAVSLNTLDLVCILTQKKERPLYIYVCLFQTNAAIFIQLFCFNNVDHLAMLCTKQKSIRWSYMPIRTPQAPVSKFQKSQNQYLVFPPFSSTVAVHPCLTERTYCSVVMSARRIPCCHDRWHKSVT